MRKIRYFGVKNIGYLEFNCACFILLKTFGWNSQVLEQSARELPSKARLQLGVHPPNDQQRYQLVSKLLICNCTSLVQIDLIILFPLPFQRKRNSGEGTKAVKKILADSEDESEEEEEEVANKEEENENGIPDKSEDEAPQPSESEEKDEPEEHSEEETPKKKRGSKVSAGKKESAGRARTKKPAAAAKSSPPEKVTQKRSSAKRKKTDDDSDASPKASSKRKKSEKATKAPAPSKEKPGLDFILFIFVFQ